MSDKLLDRFARGELSPAESRDLAQQALDDHDLYDELTSTGIARRGLATRGRKRISWPRSAIFLAAAAVIVGVVLRAPQRNSEPVKPDVAIAAPPALLARNGASNPATFRGADTESRESRATGSIGSIADGIATINLGSVDGLAKDAVVDVIRGGQATGHLKLTTVFRDHSRGEIASGASISVNDQIRVPPSARLRAILDQIDAALARGEAEKAMSIAQQASIESFDATLSSDEDLNNAGIIAELHGNRTKAVELYGRALQTNPSGQDRQAIEKNLARLRGAK
jgi:tetratricopeptide (TPR) repeat protein